MTNAYLAADRQTRSPPGGEAPGVLARRLRVPRSAACGTPPAGRAGHQHGGRGDRRAGGPRRAPAASDSAGGAGGDAAAGQGKPGAAGRTGAMRDGVEGRRGGRWKG